ncbi:uncharacterized protein [Fopius arisanus]|uniref:LOCU_0 protein n=1 Tax=Fopius arisanus TaxID=64838 RepID=A0A0C9QLU2_9HYME|nr:PREDICTED: uncharacterized protein LOC105270444 [Fopius arisanus]
MKLHATVLIIVISVGNFIKADGCNCSHCEDSVRVIGIEENEDNQSTDNRLDKEDLDGDGSRTICARDRDHEDQTFPSICHMKCYNRCSEFHLSKRLEFGYIFKEVAIYRTNYYKLHEGPCPKRMKKIYSNPE